MTDVPTTRYVPTMLPGAKKRGASFKSCCLSPPRAGQSWPWTILPYSLVMAPVPKGVLKKRQEKPSTVLFAPTRVPVKKSVDAYFERCEREAAALKTADNPSTLTYWRGLELRWSDHAAQRTEERGIPMLTHIPKDCFLLPGAGKRILLLWYRDYRFAYVVTEDGFVVTALWPGEITPFLEAHL